MLRLLLVAAAMSLAVTPAHAEPVSLTIAGINALLGTSLAASTVVASIGAVTLTLGSVVGTALAVGGSLLVSALMRPGGGRQTINPSAGRSTFETSQSGVIRGIGRTRNGGVKFFGNTANADRMRLIGHSAGLIDGVEQHYLGGREVVVDPDGAVSSPPYVRPGGSYIYIRAKAGDGSETSWVELQSRFPSLWTVNHRVRGIAQSLIQYISPGLNHPKFLKLYQSGAPDYERIQRNERLYDPRTGLTLWSDNGVLAVLHILLGLPGFDPSDFDMTYIAGEATRADIIVATRTGTEKRSRAWGLWDEDAVDRGEVLRQVLLSTGCELVARPGDKLGIHLIDDDRPAEVTIAKRHIVNFTLKAGPEGVERPNRCRVKYYSPERNYDMAEVNLVIDPADPAALPLAWSVAQSEIDRVGEVPVEYTLPFCPSPAQAQRIARRLFATARADSGIANTNMVGMAVWGTKTIAFEVPDLDLTLACEIQPARVDDESGTVEIPFVATPILAPWNPAVHEAMPPDVIPDMGYESDVPAPAVPSAATVVIYPDTSIATRIAYVKPSGIPTIEATFRDVTAVSPGPYVSMVEYESPGHYCHAYAAADLRTRTCEFRVRSFNADEDASNWSPVLTAVPAVINTAPPPPTLTYTTSGPDDELIAHFRLTAPAVLHVASLYITGPDAPGLIPAMPGQVIEFDSDLPSSPGLTVEWTAEARASDGTASALVEVEYSVPDEL